MTRCPFCAGTGTIEHVPSLPAALDVVIAEVEALFRSHTGYWNDPDHKKLHTLEVLRALRTEAQSKETKDD